MSQSYLLKSCLILISIFWINLSIAQETGDTIKVQAFTFDNDSRDMVVPFPSDDNLSFEKILLKYTMRCTDGLVSTASNVNLGCGQWDFSCNTYLADSSKAESVLTTIPSHFITNFDGDDFPYVETPTYDYMRGTMSNVEVLNVNSETTASVGNGTDALSRVVSTEKAASKSYYLYTADELLSEGLSAGEIHGLGLNVLAGAGQANFLKVKMMHSNKSELGSLDGVQDLSEVYYNNQTFLSSAENRLQFHTPFAWDGSSNIIMEFSSTNIDGATETTDIEGESTAQNMGLSSTNEQEIMLTNNSYIECDNYMGVDGSQNRTVEAWIKTTDGSNGEIISWGTIVTGRKWVFRLTNGLLRMEVHGGGTVSSSSVDDGEWHHVVCVLNGTDLGDISFYIDGVLDSNSTVGTTAINSNTTSSKVRISRGLSNRYLDASIDEVRIWDTNLTEETINQWKNLKLDASHPNYENLQLYYQFDGNGNAIMDSSPNGRHGTLIGDRFSLSEISGPELFKDFSLDANRPAITFLQGDYTTNVTTSEIDRPIAKNLRHLVISRSIVPTDPNFAKDDNIIIDGPSELWVPEEVIFDEATGDIIDMNSLVPDGEINLATLEYFRRFPYYNELVSFVTPYGIELDLGQEGASWTFDLSDYVSILKGNKRMLMTLGGQRQEDMDLEFQFIVGTPPRDVVQYEQLWQGTNRIGIATIDQIRGDEKFQPFDIQLNSEASTFKLRSSITGHGVEGEFQQNGGVINHSVNINQDPAFNWNINKECSFNPIYPQGGTWIYDRQGWCPGERSIVTEHDLSSFANAGESLNVDYSVSAPQVSTGDYRYHVAHQLVGYGAANFNVDASVISVIAPNSAPEFTRVGTICTNPTIVIQNTGAETLTNLNINYWLNDSQSPQTFNWTGSLEFMETEEVVLASNAALWYDILASDNKFYAEVSNPNGGQDEYEFNNNFSSEFNFPEILPSNITVEFRTNNNPTENSYQLIDGDGEVIGSNDLQQSNTTYSDDYELTGDCYKLIVSDSGGDGVQWWANAAQGTGSIRIRDESGSSIRTLEPDFGGGFEFSFSTSFPVSAEDLDFLTSINVYPNPATNFAYVEGDNLQDAQISLINTMGQLVKRYKNSSDKNIIEIDISQVQAGLFYVVIEKDEIVTTRKLLIN